MHHSANLATFCIELRHPLRILVIDDEFLIVKSISRLLSCAGHHVLGTAGSLARAVELIETTEFDIAIVDANLNGISAEPLVKRLLDSKVPTLLITGYSDKLRPSWAPNEFLTKPFDVEELLQAINALCSFGQRDFEQRR